MMMLEATWTVQPKRKASLLLYPKGTPRNESPSSPMHRIVSSSTTLHSPPARFPPSGIRTPNSTIFGRTSSDRPGPWPRDDRKAQRLSDRVPTQNSPVPAKLGCTATEVSHAICLLNVAFPQYLREVTRSICMSLTYMYYTIALRDTSLPLFTGIEHLQSAQVLRARINERQKLMEAVLHNQGLMPKHLAKISRRMSNEGVQRAIDAGTKDAEEVREYFSSISLSGSMGRRADFLRAASDSLLR